MTEEQKEKMRIGREKAKAEKAQQTEPETKQDKVVIEKSFLEEIRKTMDEQKGTIAKQNEDIEMLKQVADKSKLSAFYGRNKESVPTQYKLRTINDKEVDKVILGWRTIKDDVYIEGSKVIENQVIELILEDGTRKEMSYINFVRLYKTVQCSKVGDRTENDSIIVKLERNDNKKVYEVDVKFVN